MRSIECNTPSAVTVEFVANFASQLLQATSIDTCRERRYNTANIPTTDRLLQQITKALEDFKLIPSTSNASHIPATVCKKTSANVYHQFAD
jgi:hypothetical protein